MRHNMGREMELLDWEQKGTTRGGGGDPFIERSVGVIERARNVGRHWMGEGSA